VVNAGRWQLHRGGIVNVWQYAVEEFDFSGGRVIFQGTNGSGKSRTLELLLPLCLDGDLHQIGSKGYDTVSMRRLMLDDYSGGPNRIGYAWIELARPAEDDAAGTEYLTSGIGVKASASSQQIADSWRFVTERRIGVDVDLVVDGTPIGATQLRDLLGAGCVYDDELFRDRIAELVYGIPAARYADLLHLQRTLRNPDVGLKVLDGQLEQILADSLPPLDPSVIGQLAQSFDDLESIRDNIRTLGTADTALNRFLSSYAGYALAVLRAAGQRGAQAGAELATARREITTLEHRLRDEESTAEKAEAEATGLDEREIVLAGRIDELKSSPAYDSVRDLADRKRAVSAARQAAVSALRQLRTQREHTEQLVDSVLTELNRLTEDTAQAGELAAVIGERMREAGLEQRFPAELPTTPEPNAPEVRETVRASLEPEDEPVEITRRVAPELDPATMRADLEQAAEHAAQAETLLRERGALTLSLLERARELETEHYEVERLRREAKDAALAGTEAAGRRNESAQRVENVARTWHEAASAWSTRGPLAALPEPVEALRPPELTSVLADQDTARAATEQAVAWMRERQPDLHAAVARARAELTNLDRRIVDVDGELARLRSGVDPEPSRPSFATATRGPESGAPFYRLVDFAEHLSPESRAGCEAALESSGLLNAWVSADGTLADPARADLSAVLAEAPAAGDTLASVLVPAAPPDSPVPDSVVRQLLERVPLSGSGGLVLSVDGTWRAGVLAGAMTKPAPEFVGAGARESARRRRIEELAETRGQLDAERDRAQSSLDTMLEAVRAWERHIDDYPPDRDLLITHTALRAATEAAELAGKKAISLRTKHSTATDQYQARHDALDSDARSARLEPRPDSLQRAHTAAQEALAMAGRLASALGRRCVGTVEAMRTALTNHARAAADLTDVGSGADRACLTFITEEAGYEERVRTIGSAAQEVERELRGMEEERATVRQRLPKARQAATDARVKVGKTQTQIDTKQTRAGELAEKETAARQRFRAVLDATGVWSAAVAEPAEPPDDLAEAYQLLTKASGETASEDVVLGNLQSLQSALAGSHDVVAHRDGDVLTVTVTGAGGPRPVAIAAREVATRLAEQRGLLSEEYQQIFDAFMLRDLADKLAAQINVAEDLCRRMNDTLEVARSSQGVHVQLDWQPAAALDETMRTALELVRMPFANRKPDQDKQLRQALTDRITTERDGHTGDYTEVLARALDYRTWYRFTVRVRDAGPDGAPRTRRMRQLSSGETRLISYVTLFAAASAFYDAVSSGARRPPARLVLLDEAFERLDEPTIARMLALLVDLDMDWVITWPSGWGLSEKIPRMHIYDVLRPKGGTGIACTHAIWTGSGLSTEDE
jgi:uncharacterized protein (TIGR02680 family)